MGAGLSLRFWGTRGLFSSPRQETSVYGGNTTSMQILHENHLIVVDTGFGVSNLGEKWMTHIVKEQKKLTIDIFYSHFHWDHIQGLPFFHPIYFPSTHLRIHSPHTKHVMLNYLDVLFDGSYSPFSGIHKMPSNIEFVQLKDKRHAIGVNLDVSFCSLNHIHSKKISDDTEVYGYKFQTKSRSIVILTDHEGVEGEVNDSVVAFSKDCDLLVHDAQFTDAEYEHKKGWGHSCFGQALKNATRINARHTLLTHHDPKRDDEEIEDHTRVLSEDYKGISFGFAKEGIIY